MGMTQLIAGIQNVDSTVLASAARIATTTSTDQVNELNTGLVVFVSVTARAGTTTLTPELHVKDPTSSKYFTAWTAAAAINSGDTIVAYLFYPGVIATANVTFTEEMDMPVSRNWRLKVTHSDTDSITYSVGASYIV